MLQRLNSPGDIVLLEKHAADEVGRSGVVKIPAACLISILTGPPEVLRDRGTGKGDLRQEKERPGASGVQLHRVQSELLRLVGAVLVDEPHARQSDQTFGLVRLDPDGLFHRLDDRGDRNGMTREEKLLERPAFSQ